MTEIAKEKKSSSPGYLIQRVMRSSAAIEYLRMWEKIYNPRFQEAACGKDPYGQDHQHHVDSILVDQHDACDGDADKPCQGRRDDSASRDSNDVPGMVISRDSAGYGAVLSDDATHAISLNNTGLENMHIRVDPRYNKPLLVPVQLGIMKQ